MRFAPLSSPAIRAVNCVVLAVSACLPKNSSIMAHSADPCSVHAYDFGAVDARCTVARAEKSAPPPAGALEIEIKESVNFHPGEERSLAIEIRNVSDKVVPITVDDDPEAFEISLSNGQVSSLERDGTGCVKGPVGSGELPRIFLAPDGVMRKRLSLKATRTKFSLKGADCSPTDLGPLPKGEYLLQVKLPIRDASGQLQKFEKKAKVS